VTRLGDFSPIGRLFSLGSVLKIKLAAKMFGLLLPTVPVMYYFRRIIGWATFWATFSQSHLVTMKTDQMGLKNNNIFHC
jgi:hypothetical protein